MALEKNKGQYERKYRRVKLTGGEASGEQFTEDFDDEGQVTAIRIYGEEAMDFDLEAVETDTSTTTEEFTLAGNSEYEVGSFSQPVLEFGTSHTVTLDTLTNVSADTVIGINLVIDERTG